MYILLV